MKPQLKKYHVVLLPSCISCEKLGNPPFFVVFFWQNADSAFNMSSQHTTNDPTANWRLEKTNWIWRQKSLPFWVSRFWWVFVSKAFLEEHVLTSYISYISAISAISPLIRSSCLRLWGWWDSRLTSPISIQLYCFITAQSGIRSNSKLRKWCGICKQIYLGCSFSFRIDGHRPVMFIHVIKNARNQ